MHRGLVLLGLGFVSAVAAASGLSGCQSTAEASLVLDFGRETDVLTRSPVPERLQVQVSSNGQTQLVADEPATVTTLDLGTFKANGVGSFQVFGTGPGNKVYVYGSTLPVNIGILPKNELRVFAQRTNELARMPGDVVIDRKLPVLATLYSQYLFVTGGPDNDTATRAMSYDFYSLKGIEAPARLPRPARSLAPLTDGLLVIDEAGASYVNVTDFTSINIDPPTGGTFADIAGGETIADGNGAYYVVGATRITGEPTQHVLKIATDGSLSFLTIAAKKLGAAAGWGVGRGLVVADGRSEAADAPSVELLGSGGSSFVALKYPARGVFGSDAQNLSDGTFVLVGGAFADGSAPPIVTLDLKCSGSCTYVEQGRLATGLTPTQAFALTDGLLVVGDRTSTDAGAPVGDAGVDGGSDAGDASTDFGSGTTTVFRWVKQSGAAAFVPTKLPRSQARAVRAPTGGVILVGGGSEVIESFIQ